MAEMIAIVGESGSGKTSSLRNLNPEETFIISTTGKRPGIRGAMKKYPSFTIKEGVPAGNFYTSSNVDNIAKVLQIIDKKMPHIKYVVADDYQYVMGFEAMEKADTKSYDKFTSIAQHAYQVLKSGMNLREDLYFIILTHSSNDGDKLNPFYRIKTQGN